MDWLLYTVGAYLLTCYLGGLGLMAKMCWIARPQSRLRRRLTRLLPGRAVARPGLPRPMRSARTA